MTTPEASGVWVVKRLRNLRSGKPETDVDMFATEPLARAFIAERYRAFSPWDYDPAETVYPTQWFLGDPVPDEYVELEGPRSVPPLTEEGGPVRRWLVTPERQLDGEWEFHSYRAWIIDARDADVAAAYVAAVEQASQDIVARYPGTGLDPWDGDGRPPELGAIPMIELKEFCASSGPDRKHQAEAFNSLWDEGALRTLAVEPQG